MEATAPSRLDDWQIDQLAGLIEEWRNKPSLQGKEDYAAKAGAMWVAAFLLLDHARALQSSAGHK